MRRTSAALNCGVAQPLSHTTNWMPLSFLFKCNKPFQTTFTTEAFFLPFPSYTKKEKTSTKTSNWFSFRSPNFRSYGSAKPTAELKRKSIEIPQASIAKKPF